MIEWSTSTMVGRSMGIDVAWGDTSKFAIVITQYRNNKVEVFYVESFEKPLMNEIINHIMRLKQRHHITKLYCDGANPEVIRELKNKDRRVSRLLRQANRRTDMVIAKQQQLADHTCQLSEETQRDVGMDLYAYVEEIHQNTSFVTATDCVPENSSSKNWKVNNRHHIMTYWMVSDSLVLTTRFQRIMLYNLGCKSTNSSNTF